MDLGPIPGKDRTVQPRPRATILLVDDYVPNLTAMEAALEPLEHRVVKARSGKEALDFLLSEETCALILLDVNMPGQDGFETAQLVIGKVGVLLFLIVDLRIDELALRNHVGARRVHGDEQKERQQHGVHHPADDPGHKQNGPNVRPTRSAGQRYRTNDGRGIVALGP